ncbi:hypothetical protein MMC07_000067 [Pseudocyphellaria aurata]|nr:hypothetical protein [Pseudocyphellaria aurata]
MLRLLIFRLIFIASYSAAVPLQDITEPHYSGQTLFWNDRVPDPNEFYDRVPIGVSSVAPNILASNSETNPESPNPNNDPGNQDISNQNLGNPAFNLNDIAFGPSVQLGDSVPSPPFQPTSPLDLGSSSGTDMNSVTVGFTETDPNIATDPNLWTVAQSSGPMCRPKQPEICPNPETHRIYLFQPHRKKSPQKGVYPLPDGPPQLDEPAPPAISTEDKDDLWTQKQENEGVKIGGDHFDICARTTYRDGVKRSFPFCCIGGVLRRYSSGATDRDRCIGLVVGRPACKEHAYWFCCLAAALGPLPPGVIPWGWNGINCMSFN